MKSIESKRIDRILIRAANWVGDAVMSTPLVRGLRRNFPNAEIAVLAKSWVAPVFENSPDIDRILIYDSKGRHARWPGILRLCRELRGARFDLAVSIQNAFEAALIFVLAGIPRRLGYDTDGRRFLLTHPVALTPEIEKRHQIDYYLGILEGIGLPAFGRELMLNVSDTERRRAGEILRFHGLEAGSPIIGINPGAAYGNAKRWPAARFAELSRRIRSIDSHAAILIFGGPGEEALGEQIGVLIGDGCVNLCGKTLLREAIALIEQCRLFITNDSGLMHAAAALHIPQIAIFGPTDHTTTSPGDSESAVIRVKTPCSPCLEPECGPGHHRCMTAVTVDNVFDMVEKRLAS
jgi:heptosyltransferase II